MNRKTKKFCAMLLCLILAATTALFTACDELSSATDTDTASETQTDGTLSTETGTEGESLSDVPSGDDPSGEDPSGEDPADVPVEVDEPLTDAVRELYASRGVSDGLTAVPEGATHITGKYTVTEPGDYYVDSEIEGKKITVNCEGATLYLVGATLSNEKKVIESSCSFTLTLIGDSSITNSNEDGSNAIDCAGTLTVNGTGSLTVTSTKNAISADCILVRGATLILDAGKDGLHAEISAYDEDTVTSAPAFSYADGGYVVLDGASVTVNSVSDGIQADTFVYLTNDAFVDITANGGAPATVTEASSDAGEAKGIKAGAIDWGAEDANGDRTELASGDYLIWIESGTVTVNSDDDAIHSDHTAVISGGTLTLTSGDDGIHAEKRILVTDGDITILRCYEGLEAEWIDLPGGTITLTSADDGVNASNGSGGGFGGGFGGFFGGTGTSASDCHIVVSGATVFVNAGGDGLDSNGSLLISGGAVYVSGSTGSGDAALDADSGIVIDGGIVLAVGSAGMLETPSSSSAQCSAVVSSAGTIAAGTVLTVCDADGTVLIRYTVPKAGQAVIFSCPGLEVGSVYSLMGNDSLLTSVTLTATVTGGGSMGPGGGIGGRPGGKPGRGF